MAKRSLINNPFKIGLFWVPLPDCSYTYFMGLNPHFKILWERYRESFTVKKSLHVAGAVLAVERMAEDFIYG